MRRHKVHYFNIITLGSLLIAGDYYLLDIFLVNSDLVNSLESTYGTPQKREGIGMKENRFLGIKEVIDLTQKSTINKFAIETHRSYPIPVRVNGQLQAAFLFCPSYFDLKEGLYLGAPHHIVYINMTNGEIASTKGVTTKQVGLPDGTSGRLGLYMLPKGISRDEFVAKQSELYSTYDVLLPEYGAHNTNVSLAIKNAAIRFKARFNIVSEPALHPCYKTIGKDFFIWLEQISP